MRRKYLLVLPILALSLASCDFSIGGNKTNNTNTEDNGGSSSNDNGQGNNNGGGNVDVIDYVDLVTDDSVYEDLAYQNIKLAAPDFTTPKIINKDKATYEDLFNLGNKVTISIKVADSELQKLQDDFELFDNYGWKSEIYRHCESVTISIVNNGNTFTWNFDDVGIRQKGNTSRETVYDSGELAGLNHFKLSFDETFDDVEAYGASAYDWTNREAERKERSNREFLGLSGIDIKWNKNYDTTHIKEVYASKLYKACGVLSQEVGLCDFNFSTSTKSYKFGTCTIFEPATKSMIKRHLKDDELTNLPNWSMEKSGTYGVEGEKYGDLYKASWGKGEGGIWNQGANDGPDLTNKTVKGKCVGVGNLQGSYIPAYERKTSTDIKYNDAQLFTLANTITNKGVDEISKVMDLGYFAVAQACNYYIGNPDDFRNNNNNYMIYISRVNGLAYYLPIDNDRCFGITVDYNPDGNGLRSAGVFDTNNANHREVNTLLKKTILANSNNVYKAIYMNYVKAIKVSDWVKSDTFNEFFNIAKTTYNSSTTSSWGNIPFTLEDSNNYSFDNYMTEKLKKVDLSYSFNNTNGGSDEDLYGPVHLVGDFTNGSWSTTNYPLTYVGNGVYEVTLSVNSNFKFKFTQNGNWSALNWGCDGSKGPNVLKMSGGDNFEVKGISGTKTITITVDTVNLTCTWEIV